MCPKSNFIKKLSFLIIINEGKHTEEHLLSQTIKAFLDVFLERDDSAYYCKDLCRHDQSHPVAVCRILQQFQYTQL